MEITIIVDYAVKGFNYTFGGSVTRRFLGRENTLKTIEDITDELNSTYKDCKVEITNVYVNEYGK